MFQSRRLQSFVIIVLIMCLALVLLVSVLMTPTSIAQDSRTIVFRGYSGNPIIGPPNAGDWDADMVYSPQIVVDNGTWYAFMLGKSDESDTPSLGLARSENGLNWAYETGNPLNTPDVFSSVNDYVIHQSGDEWSLYFDGSHVGQSNTSIFHASTTDLSEGWIQTETILTDGDVGAWDSQAISPSSLIENDDGSTLFYTGTDDNGITQIGLASPSGGSRWGTYDTPVLGVGSENAWDGGGVSNASVWYTSNAWEMFYTGVDRSGENFGIGYATSTNGMEWFKHPNNPVIQLTDPNIISVDSSVWVQDDSYFLYTEQSDGIDISIGRAEPDPESADSGSPTPLTDAVSPTPLDGPDTNTYPDEVEDTVNCQNQEVSIDSEVDISQISTQLSADNTLTMQVHMVEPLETDYSFAVMVILRAGETLRFYVWEIHATILRIGAIDAQTGALLDDQSNVTIEHDQENGLVTFTILDAEAEEFAVRSFHTPDAETQPQPTSCDVAGPFFVR